MLSARMLLSEVKLTIHLVRMQSKPKLPIFFSVTTNAAKTSIFPYGG